jgi:hypothetical protein
VKASEFPALYRSADDLARTYQGVFFRTVFGHLAFLVIAAVLSVIYTSSAALAIGQAVALLCALACSVYLLAARPDQHWYRARAVAESIKTATWRFVSVAEPFDHTTTQDRHNFGSLLRAIVNQNREITQRLTTFLDGEQITREMLEKREKTLDQRLELYLSQRIGDQRLWYAKQATHNRKMATLFFLALIGINAVTIVFAIARVHFTTASHWPTDALIAMAASLLAWIQSKRFSELASSYALAAHEISLIKEQSASVHNDDAFSRFVGDAENAFSREHTQWVARKDQ